MTARMSMLNGRYRDPVWLGLSELMSHAPPADPPPPAPPAKDGRRIESRRSLIGSPRVLPMRRMGNDR